MHIVSTFLRNQHVKARKHVIGTVIINIKFIIGAKSTKIGQSPVRIAANTAQTTVAK